LKALFQTPPRFTPLQLLAHLFAWSLAIWLLYDYFTDHLTVNPLQAATQRAGRYALILLMLSLSISPLYRLLGWRSLLKLSRPLGVYAALFAVAHFLIFTGLDYRFNWGFLLDDLVTKKFIWVGLPALLILAVLALTSTQGWMRRLGKRWKQLHRLVYLAGFLVVLHFAWARKGDLFNLRGDIRAPLGVGLLLLILLALRLPPVRRWSAGVWLKSRT